MSSFFLTLYKNRFCVLLFQFIYFTYDHLLSLYCKLVYDCFISKVLVSVYDLNISSDIVRKTCVNFMTFLVARLKGL